MSKQTDVEIVKRILDEHEGDWNSQDKAEEIVKVLGKRIRQRARNRANEKSREDVNQAAFGIVKETTERD